MYAKAFVRFGPEESNVKFVFWDQIGFHLNVLTPQPPRRTCEKPAAPNALVLTDAMQAAPSLAVGDQRSKANGIPENKKNKRAAVEKKGVLTGSYCWRVICSFNLLSSPRASSLQLATLAQLLGCL